MRDIDYEKLRLAFEEAIAGIKMGPISSAVDRVEASVTLCDDGAIFTTVRALDDFGMSLFCRGFVDGAFAGVASADARPNDRISCNASEL